MRLALLVLLVGACGDDAGGGGTADSNMQGGDGSMQGDGSLPGTCDYAETTDATNGSSNGAELTMKTLGASLAFCGAVNNGHFAGDLIDADAFKFTIGADTDVLLRVS